MKYTNKTDKMRAVGFGKVNKGNIYLFGDNNQQYLYKGSNPEAERNCRSALPLEQEIMPVGFVRAQQACEWAGKVYFTGLSSSF
jgi:hypothetical protein